MAGQIRSYASEPRETGFCFTCSSVSSGIRYPFRRKASPKGFNFGKIAWQVWHDVWYFREKTGTAPAGRGPPKTRRIAIPRGNAARARR